MDDGALSAAYAKKEALLRKEGNYSKKRLDDLWHQRTTGRYIGDIIFGANDGIVTTFAVVSGATGGQLAPVVVIIMGVANLIADGISMGLGNYLGQRSERLYAKGQREKEDWEIHHFPEIEKKEISNIFSKWGFTGTDLDRAVTVATSRRDVWIDLMMKHELEINISEADHPSRKGLATFVSFIIAGAVPLLPFIAAVPNAFWWSVGMTVVELFSIGALRSKVTPISWYAAGFEMLGIGSLAAGAAYGLGVFIRSLL